VAPIVAAKGSTITGKTFSTTQFSVDLVAKDVALMLATAVVPLPGVTAVLGELVAAQRDGRGGEDFSVIALPEL
jgi:3-hydroxyisobutyrate dehydrogenase-like beta-hydroxyacid dehydrogenase